MRFIIFMILLLIFLKGLTQVDVNNYGPYKLQWTKFEICKGVKRRDCGLVHVENKQNMSDFIFILDFSKACTITKGKVTAGSVNRKNGTTNKLWNYYLNSPCQHFALGPILTKSFNLTKSCQIQKGHYEVHIDMYESNKYFLGNNFFYGEYVFKLMAFNNIENIICYENEIKVIKL